MCLIDLCLGRLLKFEITLYPGRKEHFKMGFKVNLKSYLVNRLIERWNIIPSSFLLVSSKGNRFKMVFSVSKEALLKGCSLNIERKDCSKKNY